MVLPTFCVLLLSTSVLEQGQKLVWIDTLQVISKLLGFRFHSTLSHCMIKYALSWGNFPIGGRIFVWYPLSNVIVTPFLEIPNVQNWSLFYMFLERGGALTSSRFNYGFNGLQAILIPLYISLNNSNYCGFIIATWSFNQSLHINVFQQWWSIDNFWHGGCLNISFMGSPMESYNYAFSKSSMSSYASTMCPISSNMCCLTF